MSSTANMMRRMPSVFAGAFCGSLRIAGGVWNFASSTRPWPSGVRIMAMSHSDAVEPDDAVHPFVPRRSPRPPAPYQVRQRTR